MGEQKAVVDNLCKSTSEQLTKSEEEVRQLQEQVEQLQLEKDLLTEELTIYVKEKTEEDDSRLQQNDMVSWAISFLEGRVDFYQLFCMLFPIKFD